MKNTINISNRFPCVYIWYVFLYIFNSLLSPHVKSWNSPYILLIYWVNSQFRIHYTMIKSKQCTYYLIIAIFYLFLPFPPYFYSINIFYPKYLISTISTVEIRNYLIECHPCPLFLVWGNSTGYFLFIYRDYWPPIP